MKAQITLVDYLFGVPGLDSYGLNQILLKLKQKLFYSKKDDLVSPVFFNHFLSSLRNMIKKEKLIYLKQDKYSLFEEKWKDYIDIYDFRGPDRFVAL